MPSNRVDRRIALLLFALIFGFYLRTLAPGLLAGDSGEFQFAAWHLGLAHPTGYPLYLLLGSAWQHLLALVGLNPATALNAFSALIGAATVALLYLSMLTWLTGAWPIRRAVAFFTALLFAVNATFWSQNLIAEVYTLHTLFVLLILRAALRTPAHPTSPSPLHPVTLSSSHLLTLCLTFGLSLTHHAMTLIWAPSLLWLVWRRMGAALFAWRTLLPNIAAIGVPLLLYLYIPLRSGPAASPWYHQTLGAEPLTLYANSGSAFWSFVTGRSISVGFLSASAALARLPEAWLLWRLHFEWLGAALMLFGVYQLLRQNRSLLVLTLPYLLIQQLFNLFYAIGDIFVYYIPMYLIGAIWAGFGAACLANGLAGWQVATEPGVDTGSPLMPTAAPEGESPPLPPVHGGGEGIAPRVRGARGAGVMLILLLFGWPLQQVTDTFARLDQSEATGARQQWETILAAQPPANAILVSDDRNEIVPLFYLQTVEKRALGITGLFPLIAPEDRFADVGATITTALRQGQERPVYLVKSMPGLGVKFALEPAIAPLVKVVGEAAREAPEQLVNRAFGPLQLLGYRWVPTAAGVRIDLYWKVLERLPGKYTTTVQLFSRNGHKLTQHDCPPGGDYYPTSLWKPGELLLDSHDLTLSTDQKPAKLLVGMYAGATFTQLAPSIEIELASLPMIE